MFDTEEVINRMFLADRDAFSNTSPCFCHTGLGSGNLEVINIENESALQFGVPVATLPFFNAYPALALQMGISIILPVLARFGVAVQSEDERTYGVVVLGFVPIPIVKPGVWPPILG